MNGKELERLAAVEVEVSHLRAETSDMHRTLDDLRVSFAKRGGVFSAVLFALTLGLGALGGWLGVLLNGK